MVARFKLKEKNKDKKIPDDPRHSLIAGNRSGIR